MEKALIIQEGFIDVFNIKLLNAEMLVQARVPTLTGLTSRHLVKSEEQVNKTYSHISIFVLPPHHLCLRSLL